MESCIFHTYTRLYPHERRSRAAVFCFMIISSWSCTCMLNSWATGVSKELEQILRHIPINRASHLPVISSKDFYGSKAKCLRYWLNDCILSSRWCFITSTPTSNVYLPWLWCDIWKYKLTYCFSDAKKDVGLSYIFSTFLVFPSKTIYIFLTLCEDHILIFLSHIKNSSH